MDQDRDTTFRGQSEDRRQALVVQEEALRSGVELDPAGAEIEAAGGLLDRLLGQVEADEGDQLAAGALCVSERAVVRGSEGGVPVRFVETEHEAARDPVALVESHQVGVTATESVDVLPEMDMGVEDFGPGGQGRGELLPVLVDQRLGPG